VAFKKEMAEGFVDCPAGVMDWYAYLLYRKQNSAKDIIRPGSNCIFDEIVTSGSNRKHIVPHLGTSVTYLCPINHQRNVCMGVIICIVLCLNVISYMCGGNQKWGE
jgi:hypothetical protein